MMTIETIEETEQNYEDLCELAHDNSTALFAVKKLEYLTGQMIALTEKLTGQTALAARRLKELQKAQDENGELQNDIQILRMMVSKNDS